MTSIPSLFISHGAPDLPIRRGSAQDFLRHLSNQLPMPRAILVISAHWLTREPVFSCAAQPDTIYDFGGFPEELCRLRYPAPGAPHLADQVVGRLSEAGFPTKTHASRGLDHGAWTPLILTYPDATIPTAQLSLQPLQTPEYHLRLGKALAPLRQEGVLIVGSGAATHNLGAFGAAYDAPPPEWAVAFDQWLADAIAQGDITSLLTYREKAPYAVQNHPTDEHLLPLFVALGAGGRGQVLHRSFTYGAFSMASYAFD
ncbi:MAG: class III extradiol ring-cleavage dioxygenase [Cyanobacteria bacterium J06638_20]